MAAAQIETPTAHAPDPLGVGQHRFPVARMFLRLPALGNVPDGCDDVVPLKSHQLDVDLDGVGSAILALMRAFSPDGTGGTHPLEAFGPSGWRKSRSNVEDSQRQILTSAIAQFC